MTNGPNSIPRSVCSQPRERDPQFKQFLVGRICIRKMVGTIQSANPSSSTNRTIFCRARPCQSVLAFYHDPTSSIQASKVHLHKFVNASHSPSCLGCLAIVSATSCPPIDRLHAASIRLPIRITGSHPALVPPPQTQKDTQAIYYALLIH